MGLRMLIIHPGAATSTSDVYDGLMPALRARGHELVPYQLDTRISRAGQWLFLNWRKARRADPSIPKPTPADVIYQAGLEAIHRALRADCEWVLVISAMYLHPDIILMLKRAGRKVGILFTESPYNDDDQARFAALADVCWTNERASVPVLRRANPNTHYLPHAYDPSRHAATVQLSNEEELARHDVVFVGTLFSERQELLAAVDWSGIDLGLYGQFPYLGSRSRLREYVRGSIVPNEVTAALYRRAKIGLNLYRTSMGFGRDAPRTVGAESLNPRALELAAAGCFTISDYRPEVAEVFGELVPMFGRKIDLQNRPQAAVNGEELGGLVRRWLADDPGRDRVRSALPGAVSGRDFAAMAARVETGLVGGEVARAVA
jgi:glycosyltransferase involved in cell wall biosynthesis